MRQRELYIAHGDYVMLVIDGLNEALRNDGVTQNERAAALELVESGFFRRNTDHYRAALDSVKLIAA